jgi:PAS domain S-box-containing protein
VYFWRGEINVMADGMNKATIRVYIIGDKSLVRPFLSKQWMGHCYEWIFSKNSPPFDTSNLQSCHPDIVLIALFGDESANEISSILPDLLKLDLPVIFISRELDSEWMLTLMKEDTYDFVFTPFDASKLNESLQVALFRKQLVQKTESEDQSAHDPFQSPREIKSGKLGEDLINDRLAYLEKLIKRSTNLITDKYQQAQQIINNALVAIISMDSQGCITAWNAQAERTFGWNCDEVIGAKLTEIILPPSKDTQNKTSLFTYDILNEQESTDHLIELQGVRRNKHVFPMELSFATISLGNAFQICVFTRDLSNRKEAEKKLKLAQAHTRFLLELSKKLAEADSSRSAGKAILQSS